jgi:hypothetical protein
MLVVDVFKPAMRQWRKLSFIALAKQLQSTLERVTSFSFGAILPVVLRVRGELGGVCEV